MTRPSLIEEIDIIHYVDELQDQVWSIERTLDHLRSRYSFEKRSASAKRGWATRKQKVRGAQAS